MSPRKKKRNRAGNDTDPKRLSPNQQRIYFILEAANAEGGCIQEEMAEAYMATFEVGPYATEMAIFRQVQVGYIKREQVPDTGPLFSHRLTSTEVGQWWVIAKENPELGFILRRRKDILGLVRANRFTTSLLEAMDNEIRRLIKTGLEQPPADPNNS